MFEIFDQNMQLIPIKVWLDSIDQLEPACFQQAINLSNLAFAKKWIVLLPDTHVGYGMPIGGVVATDNMIIPNAVGVDIGCGMTFIQTTIPKDALTYLTDTNQAVAQLIVNDIIEQIPTGFNHHKAKQDCQAIDDFHHTAQQITSTQSQSLLLELERAKYQIKTLGGGNHFIELQINQENKIAIMIHSGSRNIGYKICHHYDKCFRQANKQSGSNIPEKWQLAHLRADSELGSEYINWMQFAMKFAKENRKQIMNVVLDILIKQSSKHGFSDIHCSEIIDCHHNYANLENHFGQSLWVHRKGAISAQKDEIGIIPGAMGSYSYIVKGKGNVESFTSCSHGAGRLMSRESAKKQFDIHQTMEDLRNLGVYLGKVKKGDLGEESRFAYKDIETVIHDQLDLMTPLSKLKTLAVVKG